MLAKALSVYKIMLSESTWKTIANWQKIRKLDIFTIFQSKTRTWQEKTNQKKFLFYAWLSSYILTINIKRAEQKYWDDSMWHQRVSSFQIYAYVRAMPPYVLYVMNLYRQNCWLSHMQYCNVEAQSRKYTLNTVTCTYSTDDIVNTSIQNMLC